MRRVQCQAIIAQNALISFGIIIIVLIPVPMDSTPTATTLVFNATQILSLVLYNRLGTILKPLQKTTKCMHMLSSTDQSV